MEVKKRVLQWIVPGVLFACSWIVMPFVHGQEEGYFYPEVQDIHSGNAPIQIMLPASQRTVTLTQLQAMQNEPWYELYKKFGSNHWTFEQASLIVGVTDECISDVPYVTTEAANEAREESQQGMRKQENTFRLLVLGLEVRSDLIEGSDFSAHNLGEQGYAFEFNAQQYLLSTEGVIGKPYGQTRCESWDGVAIAGYRLYLTDSHTGQKQLLTAHPFCSTIVYFIGDLDGDGKPDFVMNRPSNYEEDYLILFLSSYALEGEVVRPVAIYQDGFDC